MIEMEVDCRLLLGIRKAIVSLLNLKLLNQGWKSKIKKMCLYQVA